MPYGYKTCVAHQDGEKQRMKLEIVPAEASVVRKIVDWADTSSSGRWIVGTAQRARDDGARHEVLQQQPRRDPRPPDPHRPLLRQDHRRRRQHPGPRRLYHGAVPTIVERDQFKRVAALISGPKAALDNGVISAIPRLEGAVRSFDRSWCPIGDKDGHSNYWEISVVRRLPTRLGAPIAAI